MEWSFSEQETEEPFIGAEGIVQFFKDIDVDPEDVSYQGGGNHWLAFRMLCLLLPGILKLSKCANLQKKSLWDLRSLGMNLFDFMS